MTWLKLADEFAKECRRARLSDAAFRVHVEGLCFAMDDENDGIIYEDDLRSFTRTADPMTAVQELCDCSFWLQLGPAKWQILHQMEHQPDAETLAARRKLAAQRQAKKRRKAAGLEEIPEQRSGSLYPRDTPSDDPRDPVRSGSVRDWESQETNPALEEKERVYGWDACPACGSLEPCDCEL